MVLSIESWIGEKSYATSRWVVLGPQTTMDEARSVADSREPVVGFGDEIPSIPVTLLHIVSLEGFGKLHNYIVSCDVAIVMPRRPNQNGKHADADLEQLVRTDKRFEALARARRLVAYELWTDLAADDGSVILGDFETAEVPMRLLVNAGIKKFSRVGWRGPSCAGNEAAMRPKGARAHGVANLIRNEGVSVTVFGEKSPVRVYIGGDDAQTLGARVLEYSIRKRISCDVEFAMLENKNISILKNTINHSGTELSLSRFTIPELTGYTGKAIYVDAAMQALADIFDLWVIPLGGDDVLYADSSPTSWRVPQLAVMLLNCETLKWDIREIVRDLGRGEITYADLKKNFGIIPGSRKRAGIPYWWNSLERYEPGRTCLLHYMDMPTQPWVSQNNPLGEIWYSDLRDAVEERFISTEELLVEMNAGHISHDLPKWAGLADADKYPTPAKTLSPPYMRFTKSLEGEMLGEFEVIGTTIGGIARSNKIEDGAISLSLMSGNDEVLQFSAIDACPRGPDWRAFEFTIPAVVRKRFATSDPSLVFSGTNVRLIAKGRGPGRKSQPPSTG